jgi:aminomethyltransferase
VTSGSFSPTLERAIAMAMVDRDVAANGTVLDVQIRDARQAATVTPIPFYRRTSARPQTQS